MISHAQLRNMVLNCDDPIVFAKTYTRLQRDLVRTFSGPELPPDLPEAVALALKKIAVDGIERMHQSLQLWFWMRWGRPEDLSNRKQFIENYVRQNTGGCASSILVVLTACTCIAIWLSVG